MSEEDIAKAKEEFDKKELEYQKAIANLEQDKANVVDELKAKREEARLAKEEAEKLKANTATNDGTTDPEEIVVRVLKKKEEEQSKNALESAKQELKKIFNEFSPETDTAGLVFGKFEKQLGEFNLSGLSTKEEYLERLKKIYKYVNFKETGNDDKPFYGGTGKSGSDAPAVDNNSLTDSEARLIRDMGITRERFLKIKEKRPAYVATLLKYRN